MGRGRYFAWCYMLLIGSKGDSECYLLLLIRGSERDDSREIGKSVVLLVFLDSVFNGDAYVDYIKIQRGRCVFREARER